MQFHQRLKYRLKLGILLWMLFATSGLGIFLFHDWNDTINKFGEESENNVSITTTLIRQTLIDASKLLDITKRDIEPVIASTTPFSKTLEDTLSKSLENFSVYSNLENYGIVYVIDKNGNLMMRSDHKSLNSINFSDRYFFNELMKNPSLRFIVGPAIKARTTHLPVFTIATPLKDTKNNFIGVLGLQMNCNMIDEQIRKYLHHPLSKISVITKNNELSLVIPLNTINPNSEHGIPYEHLSFLEKSNVKKGWFREDGEIVAIENIPEIDLQVASETDIASIKKIFYQSNIKIVLILLVLTGIFLFLALKLARVILNADTSRMLSVVDSLTLLPNRRAFEEAYEKFLKEAQRNQHPISILFIDIDHFKICNDTYGHENGDLVLKRVAELTQQCMRRPFDFCCRWGGEELVCLLPNTDSDGATNLAEIIRNTICRESIKLHGFDPIHITVSIGIASASHSHTIYENNLVDKADQAMYRAKQAGRNRCST